MWFLVAVYSRYEAEENERLKNSLLVSKEINTMEVYGSVKDCDKISVVKSQICA